MSIRQQLQALTTSIATYSAQVVAALHTKSASAGKSDNALKLNGQLPATMKATADTTANTHINNHSNVHQLTPAQLGTPPRAQVEERLAPLIPQGTLPISRWGSLDGAPLGIQSSGWVLNITKTQIAIFNGRYYVAPIASVDVSLTTGNPANQTFNIYLKLTAGVVSYIASPTFTAERFDLMWLGTVTTNASVIASFAIGRVTKLGRYRLSTTAVGSGTPVTPGVPSQVAHIDPSWIP